jgi:hypothetical protein
MIVFCLLYTRAEPKTSSTRLDEDGDLPARGLIPICNGVFDCHLSWYDQNFPSPFLSTFCSWRWITNWRRWILRQDGVNIGDLYIVTVDTDKVNACYEKSYRSIGTQNSGWSLCIILMNGFRGIEGSRGARTSKPQRNNNEWSTSSYGSDSNTSRSSPKIKSCTAQYLLGTCGQKEDGVQRIFRHAEVRIRAHGAVQSLTKDSET